jgi:hypothetical protein
MLHTGGHLPLLIPLRKPCIPLRVLLVEKPTNLVKKELHVGRHGAMETQKNTEDRLPLIPIVSTTPQLIHITTRFKYNQCT